MMFVCIECGHKTKELVQHYAGGVIKVLHCVSMGTSRQFFVANRNSYSTEILGKTKHYFHLMSVMECKKGIPYSNFFL